MKEFFHFYFLNKYILLAIRPTHTNYSLCIENILIEGRHLRSLIGLLVFILKKKTGNICNFFVFFFKFPTSTCYQI